ncbi:MAG TPA: metal ABC transporter permease [Candidatus Pacearchaeota archaeon]|nr:metal ABC transporter permease [Candidatus Pacearchaeota archaeon]HOK94392.1 metal ABC transporter permease [Candidatus Pacearchaeota archaeon]HPO75269.1 metal ABC transporter permease [Candidatus Pacearchaeota archaeon]
MDQFLLSLIAGIFIGGVAGYLGTLMFSKRMSLVADPLSHLTLPGIALALLYGFDVSLGAFPFVILGIILIWFFEKKTKLPMEALTAIVFVAGVAISFLFLPIEEAETALVGDITKITLRDVIINVVLCLLIFFTVKKIYPKMVLINISEDLAKAEKINVEKYNFIYLLIVAIIVSLGAKMVGGLLTTALIAIPSATSRNVSKSLSQFSLFGLLFGVLSTLLGILLFKITGLPAGPLIVIVATLFFLISIIFKN